MDPYPDLPGAELPVHARVDRTELSEADSRLLDALSQPTTPVVSAVEDERRTADDGPTCPWPAGAAPQRRCSGSRRVVPTPGDRPSLQSALQTPSSFAPARVGSETCV